MQTDDERIVLIYVKTYVSSVHIVRSMLLVISIYAVFGDAAEAAQRTKTPTTFCHGRR
jgi:hypothetical protein